LYAMNGSFFFQAADGIRGFHVTGVQTCALPIFGQIAKLEGKDGQLDHIHLTMDSGDTVLPATRLLPFFGLTMKLGPVADWGLERSEERRVGREGGWRRAERGLYKAG